VIETFSKLYEELFGKKCESASVKLHFALYTFIVAGISYITWISWFIVCTLFSSSSGAFFSFNELEMSGRK